MMMFCTHHDGLRVTYLSRRVELLRFPAFKNKKGSSGIGVGQMSIFESLLLGWLSLEVLSSKPPRPPRKLKGLCC
jgi:hypothetical protein